MAKLEDFTMRTVPALVAIALIVGCGRVEQAPPRDAASSAKAQSGTTASAPESTPSPSPSPLHPPKAQSPAPVAAKADAAAPAPKAETQAPKADTPPPAAPPPAPPPPAPPPTTTEPLPKAESVASAAPKSSAPPAPKPASSAPAAPKQTTPPAPKTNISAPAAPKQEAPPAPPPLDLASLETRLKETRGIGIMTKLALKNQVDDLLDQFREYYRGRLKTTLADLHKSFDLLVLKVLSLLQDTDPSLANAIVASRDAIWGILTDRTKFTKYATL